MTELVPARVRTAFDDFLDRAIVHERMCGGLSPFLIRVTLLADGALIGLVILGSWISSNGARTSGVFVVGGDQVAGLVDFLHSLMWPLLGIAILGLGLKGLMLWRRRLPAAVHYFCAVESTAALGFGVGWFLVFAAWALAIVLWVVFIVLCIAAVLGLAFFVLRALLEGMGG